MREHSSIWVRLWRCFGRGKQSPVFPGVPASVWIRLWRGSGREGRLLSHALTVLVCGTFFYAGAVKMGDPGAFARNIRDFRLPLLGTEDWVALVLPPLEIVCALLLFVPGFRRFSLLVLGGLDIAFLLVLAQARLRGLEVDCGCFGQVPPSPEIPIPASPGNNLGAPALPNLGAPVPGDLGTSISHNPGASISLNPGTSVSPNPGTLVSGDLGTPVPGDSGTSVFRSSSAPASGDLLWPLLRDVFLLALLAWLYRIHPSRHPPGENRPAGNPPS